MRKFFLFFFLPTWLLSADNAISQSAQQRHEDMLQYFLQPSSQTEPHDLWHRQYMLDNWGGRRNKLADLGATIDSSYVTDMLGNPVGGKARGFAYAGSYGMSLNIDFSQIGLTGLDLFTGASWRTGTNLSKDKIDNQFTVAQVYGSQTVRLVQLCLIETLWDKRFILKAGRLCAGDDFLASPLYGKFVNNAFDGNPVAIFFNIPFTAYPNATWGAYLELKPWQWLSTKWAVFNANSEIQANKYHGVNFTFSSTNGVVWITEWCALINQRPNNHGMPGNYKVGAFYLTGSKEKFLGGHEQGDPGLYLLLDQMIYRFGSFPSKRGIIPFINFCLQPTNRNLFPFFTNGGVVVQGPLASRPDDSVSLGFAYGRYSSALRQQQEEQGLPKQHAETVLEATYWCQISPWFYIMPDIQYIIRPKGLSTPNALVIGAQIGLSQW